jgi:hypothetical protein
MLSAIERARRYVLKCPGAVSGQGGHDQTFHVAAIVVNGFALGEHDALTVLRDWNGSCQPPWSESELVHKIKSAAAASHQFPRGYLLGGGHAGPSTGFAPATPIALPPKPKFKPGALKRIAAKTSEIKDVLRFIAERSPVRVDTQNAASVLRRLYARGSGEKVIVFTDMHSQGQFVWEADNSDVIQCQHLPTGADGVWFLPQPVSGEFHPNPRDDGKLSRRAQEAVTSWRYVVLESDKADKDDWLRCLVQLPLRIACICDSGGRSIHALARIDAASKLDWDARVGAVKPILVTLGADAQALSAVRLSRLPCAMRGERGQELLYLNTEPTGLPILQLPTQEVLYGRKWHGEATPDE